MSAALAVAMAGCAIGPTYRRPAARVPADWKSAWKPAVPRDAEPRGWWWELFADQTLNDLARQAIDTSPTLQAAAARVIRARAIARIERADLLPRADASFEYTHALRSLRSFGGGGSIDLDNFSTPLDLSYEVDLWGRVRRSFEAARAEAQASEAAYHTALLTLTADVASNYILIRQLDAEQRILDETVALRRRAQELVSQRVEAGVVSSLDSARVDTEVAAAEADLLDVTRRRAQVEHALAVLCGRPPSEFGVPAYPLLIPPPLVPPGLPSELLERRPDVAEAERHMAAANARIGVAQAAYFPTIRLTGSGGFTSAELQDLFNWDSHVWSLGPSVSVPIFTGGRGKAGVRSARATYDEAVAVYQQRVLVAFREVEDALSDLYWRAEQGQVQERAVAAAREAARLTTARYGQGLVNFLEVVDAERSRLAAERAAVQILSQRLLATVLLLKALGGSWNAIPPASS
jgi:multidrug efflux system outer membrane protein